MTIPSYSLRFLLLVCLLTLLSASNIQAQTKPLLDITGGRIPSDHFPDRETKLRLVNNHPQLKSKALEIKFGTGGSFGDNPPAVKDWSSFTALQFAAFNPTSKSITLTLNAFHPETQGFESRIVHEFELKPGRNSINIPVTDLKNADGSQPSLEKILKWFINVPEDESPTLVFSDLRLTSDSSPAETEEETTPPAVLKSLPPLRGTYRIRGKVGDLNVDLILTPEDAPESIDTSEASPPAPTKTDPNDTDTTPPDNSIKTDPQRLERIRSAPPVQVKKPISFETPEADAVLAGLEVFPSDNHWNVLVEDWPVHPDSAQIIETVGANLPFRINPDMSFILVNASQKKIDVPITEAPDESDPGPYPVPDNTPIEGWPVNYINAVDEDGKKLPQLTLDQHQRDLRNEGGDRHSIIIDVQAGKLFEFYQMKKTDEGWTASGAAIFDLRSNALRPETWTSADAAGLPIFPAVIRYDELQRGVIDHALRVTFTKTRRAYVYPARHYASDDEDPSLPRMGERLRLRPDFDDSDFSPHAKTIITALKRYGMFVADNGIPWAISSTPDPRMPNLHAELRKINGTDFEVIIAPQDYPQPE